MLQVGYLSLNSPVALVASQNADYPLEVGLLILSDLDLDRLSPEEIRSLLIAKRIPGRAGFSVRSNSQDLLQKAAVIAAENRCLMELDLTGYDSVDGKGLSALVRRLKRHHVTLSARIRAGAIDADTAAELARSGLDLLHLDISGSGGAGLRLIRKLSDAGAPTIMALAEVGDFNDAKAVLSMGAGIISLNGSAQQDFVLWLSGAMKEYDRLTGWYNAPKHICSGGDLRGLAFCCPPVKACSVQGALEKLGLSPKEFVRMKLEIARGTPLEKGEGTCFGSLIWCCKISKPCFMRDAALRKIGLSERDYMDLKRKVADELLRSR